MLPTQNREPLDRTCFCVTHNQELLAGLISPIAGAVKLIEGLEGLIVGMIAGRLPCAPGRICVTQWTRARHSRKGDTVPFPVRAGRDVVDFEKQILI